LPSQRPSRISLIGIRGMATINVLNVRAQTQMSAYSKDLT
jgi:hypothetical protein